MNNKKQNINTGHLLDDLAAKLQCDYLSDFKLQPGWQRSLMQAISKIPAEMYSLEEWTETAKYLLSQTVQFISVEEAKSYLCEALGKTGTQK